MPHRGMGHQGDRLGDKDLRFLGRALGLAHIGSLLRGPDSWELAQPGSRAVEPRTGKLVSIGQGLYEEGAHAL